MTKQQTPLSPLEIKGRWIILKNGSYITLKDWQDRYKINSNQVGKYFSLSEEEFAGPNWAISELVILVIDELRERSGTPKIVNDFFRTQTEQNVLVKKKWTKAKISTHQFGLAIDIDTKTKAETRREVKRLKKIAKDFNIKIRIGYISYMKKGWTMIHFDVAPEYFCPGKPYHHIKHSRYWEMTNIW